jgi:phage-related protein
MTKLVSASMEALFALIVTISEGTFNILSNIYSVISDLFMVFIRFGADGASGAVNYVIDQLSTVFKIITEGGQSILELIYNLFSSLAEKIFNYMKKYYMTINNIEAE